MVELPYGRVPYLLELNHRATVIEPPTLPPPGELGVLLDAALAAPIGSLPVSQLVGRGARVTLVVSDATRDEPRAMFVRALARQLPEVAWTIAVATGTHGPSTLEALALPPALLETARIVNHDGNRDEDLVDVGVTSRGTRVRLHRCVIEADLVVATGCIRPHYFAGFGAGAKAIFPGLGAAADIRVNHRWKAHPSARAGAYRDNPCRDDLEEAARMVPTQTFLLNGVVGPDRQIHAAVAGDLVEAFRAGAARASSWFRVDAPTASLVVASDVTPVTSSLYQAAKIAAAVAPLCEPGGHVVLVAECADGVGPLDVVNEAILRLGVLPRLPSGARLSLVSSLSPALVARTLVHHAASAQAIIDAHTGRWLVVPRASQLVFSAP